MIYDFETIMEQVDIEEVLQILGVEGYKRSTTRGPEYYFRCVNPNHDDTNPSCSIALQGEYKGLFYCWSCGFRGNLFYLLSLLLKISYAETIDWLAKRFDIRGISTSDYLMRRLKRRNQRVKEEKIEIPDFKIPERASPHGFRDPFCYRAESYLLSRNIFLSTQIQYEVHSYIHSSIGYSVLVPFYFKGRLASFFYCEPKRGGRKWHQKGTHIGHYLFNYDNLKRDGAKEVIVVESILDVLMLHSLGIKNVVAVNSNNVTKHHLKLLSEFDVISVFPDNDSDAGWVLVERIVNHFGKSINLLIPPKGKDPGDCSPEEISSIFSNKKKFSDWEVEQFFHSTGLKKNFNVTKVLKNSSKKNNF